MALFNFNTKRHLLDVEQMDHAHGELAELLNTIDTATASTMANGLSRIEAHCITHFGEEELLMLACNSGHLVEHRREHAGILHELTRCRQQLDQGKTMFAKAWLKQRFPEWLERHLQSMDSALAAELKAPPSTRTPGHQLL